MNCGNPVEIPWNPMDICTKKTETSHVLPPVRIESSITTCRPTQVLGRIRWNSFIGIRAPGPQAPETVLRCQSEIRKQPGIYKGLYLGKL